MGECLKFKRNETKRNRSINELYQQLSKLNKKQQSMCIPSTLLLGVVVTRGAEGEEEEEEEEDEGEGG